MNKCPIAQSIAEHTDEIDNSSMNELLIAELLHDGKTILNDGSELQLSEVILVLFDDVDFKLGDLIIDNIQNVKNTDDAIFNLVYKQAKKMIEEMRGAE